MKITGADLFQTRVARRVMGLFLLCALVPILALGVTSYMHVTSQLRDQAVARLQIESKAAGMSVIERLQLVESNVRAVRQTVRTAATSGMPAQFQLPHGVLGLALSPTDGDPVPLAGDGIPSQTLSLRQRSHLLGGKSVVVVVSRGIVLVAQALDPNRLDDGIIWAKVHPPYLWSTDSGDSRLLPSVTMCVFGADGTMFTCPYDEHTMPEALRSGPDQTAQDEFRWTFEGEEYLAAQWTIFLGFEYSAPSWRIVLGEPGTVVLAPLADFKRTFPMILLLAIVVVVGVSHRQVRNSMEPLTALTEGTESIARQQFDTTVTITSGDEFEDLAGSFNTMARQLGKQFHTLTAMSEIDRAVLSDLDRNHIVETVLHRTSEALSCNRVAVALQTDAGDQHSPWRVTVAFEGTRREHDVPVSASELDELAQHPGHMVFHRTGESRSYLRDWTSGNGDPVVILPLTRKDEVVGLIALAYVTAEPIGAELREARQLADQVSVALSNAHLVDELDSLSAGALTALARTIDANSHWTAGHSERVTTVSLAIAREMGLPQENLDTLYRGGLLHDIGKIAVPPTILDKPGKLTDEEFEIVKQHPSTGARILAPIKAYADTIPIVLYHHEKLDGTGYPDGLAGDEIPYLAKLLCVADVYDALTSARPYRPGWPAPKAAQYLLDGAGTQFDPDIAAAFRNALMGGRIAREPSVTLEAVASPSTTGNGRGRSQLHNAIEPALRLAQSDL